MTDFAGFPALDANFTPTPNLYFDVVLREEDCVSKVVGFLIRDTLGWQDRVTRNRRVEAGLSLGEFMERGMARNSARKGIDLAVRRGYIVKTADETPRTPARYALRWEDGEAQTEAIRRERLANSDPIETRAPAAPGGQILTRSKNDPLRGSNFDPLPIYRESGKKEEKEIQRVLTLNVGEEVNSVGSGGAETGGAESGVFSRAFAQQAAALAAELQDLGSERRHCQLLEICDRNGLEDLAAQALKATRERMGKEKRRGVIERPGAYYQSILVKSLEDHQVFVPRAGEDDADEVRRQARESLGL
jgi:hypothetical protein